MLEIKFYLSIQGRNIALTHGTQLTQSDIPDLQPQSQDNIVAQVNPNPKNPAILGLNNCSTQVWTVTLPNGNIRQIQTGQTIKLEDNTQIIFGLINGVISSQSVSSQVVTDEDYDKSQDSKKKKKSELVIICSIIAVTFIIPFVAYDSLLLISSFFDARIDTSSKEETASIQNNSCDKNNLDTRRNALGFDGWNDVNKIFSDRTGHPLGQMLDPNHSKYDFYREQWCKIADEWLSEKELKNSSSTAENLVTKLSNLNKTWQGYFDSKPATLSLDYYEVLANQNFANFTGKLTVSDKNTDSHFIVKLNGSIDSKAQTISFKETEYVATPADHKWFFGSNQGRIFADSFSMSGDGRDTNLKSYFWCFDFIDSVKTCTNEQANNIPSPEPTSSVDSTAPELSEDQAAILINLWLQAKQRIFGSSHDKNLIAKIFTGKAHEKVQKNVNKIEQNQEYYIFEKQEVKRIDNFSGTVSTEVIIDVTLNEIYKLYNNQGKVDSQENNQENSEYYGIMRVHLVYSENQWKIADFYNIKELQ